MSETKFRDGKDLLKIMEEAIDSLNSLFPRSKTSEERNAKINKAMSDLNLVSRNIDAEIDDLKRQIDELKKANDKLKDKKSCIETEDGNIIDNMAPKGRIDICIGFGYKPGTKDRRLYLGIKEKDHQLLSPLEDDQELLQNMSKEHFGKISMDMIAKYKKKILTRINNYLKNDFRGMESKDDINKKKKDRFNMQG